MDKKIFIDCGARIGESVRKAREIFGEDIVIHSFEPVPSLWKHFEKLPTILHKQAVWIYDGVIEFYLGKKKNTQSSTLIKYRARNVDYTKPIQVPCVDFSKWIMENFNKDDYIILKLNIECAEYEVLEKMMKDGSIRYINEIYGCFHAGKFQHRYAKDDKKLVARLKAFGLEWKKWYVKY